MASAENQCMLVVILDIKLKFSMGDGVLVQGGFVSRPSGGLEPPA